MSSLIPYIRLGKAVLISYKLNYKLEGIIDMTRFKEICKLARVDHEEALECLECKCGDMFCDKCNKVLKNNND